MDLGEKARSLSIIMCPRYILRSLVVSWSSAQGTSEQDQKSSRCDY